MTIMNNLQHTCERMELKLSLLADIFQSKMEEAKRDNWTIVEAARARLHAFKLLKQLWSCTVDCAVYTLNRMPSERKDTTSFEK